MVIKVIIKKTLINQRKNTITDLVFSRKAFNVSIHYVDSNELSNTLYFSKRNM